MTTNETKPTRTIRRGVTRTLHIPCTITFRSTEFATAGDAIQHAKTNRGSKAIRLYPNGRNLVIAQEDADRLAAAGVEFAYLCDHKMPDGTHRIMTVPVN